MAGLQARARAARYDLLSDWCRVNGAKHLFVGHHQGDQAETFVMRLARSSTLFGLAAMDTVRDLHGVRLCRPVLDIPKNRLQATLKARGQAWLEDPSNTNPAFERVRTRVLIQALQGEGITPQRLAGAARAAGRLKAIVERAVADFVETAVTVRPGAGLVIDGAAFAVLLGVVQERALGTVLHRVHAQPYGPSPAKIERLAAWMVRMDAGGRAGSRAGGQARTLGGCVVRRTKTGFTVMPEAPRAKAMGVKKDGFFIGSPLPPGLKSLTSPTGGAAPDDVCAHTKC